MRSAVLLLLTVLPVAAQTPDKTLDALLSEVRELRLAIERSTLLGTRTQLLLSQLQLQDAAVARASQQYNEAHAMGLNQSAHMAKEAENIKAMESALNSPEFAAQEKHASIERTIAERKAELEQDTLLEQQRAARESELANQLRAAQNAVADTRARIAQMEQALDTAINQLLKPRQ